MSVRMTIPCPLGGHRPAEYVCTASTDAGTEHGDLSCGRGAEASGASWEPLTDEMRQTVTLQVLELDLA